MGKTVIKHEDVEMLYELISQKEYERNGEIEHDDFREAVEEIFGVTLPIESEKEKENK